MNSKGQMKTGTVVLIIAVLVGAYFLNVGGLKDMLAPSEPMVTGDDCPSSGLTEVTLNAQEALASSATNANVTYFVYDNGQLVTTSDTGSDGSVAFDVECGVGKTYQMLVLNEKTQTGYYPLTVNIDASGPTDIHNVKVYEYGQINVASITSSSDPTGDDNISAGTGKLCGFTVTFSENESAAAINKPIILCLVNTSAVTDMNMVGANENLAKKPARISSPGGHQYFAFEYPELVKSTSGAIKVSGNLQFSSSMTVDSNAGKNNMSCIIVDQATYAKSDFKTLGLSDGFVEAGENKETLTDIGAPDSNRKTLEFGGTYC